MNNRAATLAHADIDNLPGKRVRLGVQNPLILDSGETLSNYAVAYQTYGTLNADKSNAILICHALTGDQFVAETHPITGKAGWWDAIVGAGNILDTQKYFIICANILGGCMGSEGPASINPATGAVWGLSFPVITIHDMVRAQKALIDHLQIEKLFLVIGGSMGGMQALSWAVQFPHAVHACAAIATAARHSAQNIAFGEVGRQAIMTDPLWKNGAYDTRMAPPAAGLSVARMAAHITYLSEDALQRKFGRRLQARDAVSFGFDADFQVESYLRHQGESFVKRFDANSYLYITRAMDYFDLADDFGQGSLASAFARAGDTPPRFLVVSFSSDWLFPPSESRALVKALCGAGADASFVDIESDKGHDAFLLDEPIFHAQLSGFIKGCEESRTRAFHGMKTRIASAREDFRTIESFVPMGAHVLEVGCGNGALLEYLVGMRGIAPSGLELQREAVEAAIARGLPVIQGDAEKDLATYPDNAFDVVIMNRTLSELQDPAHMLREVRRLAPQAIISVSNFAHWKARADIALRGRAPVTPSLPHAWHNSPNIRFCTLSDFHDFAQNAGFRIIKEAAFDRLGKPLGPFRKQLCNVFAAEALYLLER